VISATANTVHIGGEMLRVRKQRNRETEAQAL
jgi:hypothetical protein